MKYRKLSEFSKNLCSKKMKKEGFDIDLADITDQFGNDNANLPPKHNLIGAKFSTMDRVCIKFTL